MKASRYVRDVVLIAISLCLRYQYDPYLRRAEICGPDSLYDINLSPQISTHDPKSHYDPNFGVFSFQWPLLSLWPCCHYGPDLTMALITVAPHLTKLS